MGTTIGAIAEQLGLPAGFQALQPICGRKNPPHDAKEEKAANKNLIKETFLTKS
jgi:hypothetical protein